MSIRRPTIGSRNRSTLEEYLRAKEYEVDARINDRVALDELLRIRGELLGGSRGIIPAVDPATAVRLLGDPDAVLGYAETLAAEAAVRRGRGEESTAGALEERALAVALAMPEAGDRAAERQELVAALKRRQHTRSA